MLELDHVFCLVDDPEGAAARLEADGWVLDDGQAHGSQGTRNRRLVWPGVFFELLWIVDEAQARASPLRMDRRARWRTTGASPVGIALRGRLEEAEREAFWSYDALGFPIWIRGDNESHPERPLVLVLDVDGGRLGGANDRLLQEVRVTGPAAPSLPPHGGPPVSFTPGAYGLELVVDPAGERRAIGGVAAIRA